MDADRPRDTDGPRDADAETELARLHPRWIWFAPATLSGVVTAAVLIGFGWRILNEAQLDPAQFSLIHQALRHLRGTPVWVDVLQGGVAVLIVVTLLSVAGYVLSFWGYRLTRHAGGTLGVSRGLLTTRSTSIEERRLRGLERSEPLLLRVVGGARLQAIATGLRHRGAERGGALLVPPAPLRTVLEVEAKVLGSAEPGHASADPARPRRPPAPLHPCAGVGRPDRRRAVRARPGGPIGRRSPRRSPCCCCRWPRCWPGIVTGISGTRWWATG